MKNIVSADCNWNAVTLLHPVNFDGLATLTSQLHGVGAQVRLFQVPGKGLLVVSWRRPDV